MTSMTVFTESREETPKTQELAQCLDGVGRHKCLWVCWGWWYIFNSEATIVLSNLGFLCWMNESQPKQLGTVS